jgi:hypothetical protein
MTFAPYLRIETLPTRRTSRQGRGDVVDQGSKEKTNVPAGQAGRGRMPPARYLRNRREIILTMAIRRLVQAIVDVVSLVMRPTMKHTEFPYVHASRFHMPCLRHENATLHPADLFSVRVHPRRIAGCGESGWCGCRPTESNRRSW